MLAIYLLLKMVWGVTIPVIEWFIQLLKDIFYMVKLLLQFMADIPSYFSWLPTPVIGIIAATFSIVVVYKILGREG